MSVITTVEKKCRAIQVMKGKGYVDKLYYITAEYNISITAILCYYYITLPLVLYHCKNSHWRCYGLIFLTLTFLNLIY